MSTTTDTTTGAEAGTRLITQNDLEQFLYREARMLVTTSGIFSPQLVIPLGHMTRAQNVRAFMRRHAQEEEQDAHLGEHLAEIFGL